MDTEEGSGSLADDLRAAMQEPVPAQETTNETTESTASDEQPTADERARDESGRFAPRTAANPENKVSESGQQKPTEGQELATQPVVQPTTEQQGARPPVSWTPTAREEWAKVPPLVQQEVMRREREITQTLAQTAEARNLHTEFNKTVQPFMGDIQAEGSTPMKAVENLMNTAAWLRRGNTQQKANVVANIIRSYGVDITALDEILAGGGGYSGQAPTSQQGVDPNLMSAFEQKLAPMQQFINQLQEKLKVAEERGTQEITQSTEQFLNDPKNEFAWDLKDDMADILDMAAKRGLQMSLQEAYSRATMLHPDISKILESRRTVPEPLSPAAIRAKQAASASISNSGAPNAGDEDDDGTGDLRSDLKSSMRKVTSGR